MEQEYDYVIVGGGSAGCVLANRLSADSAHSVLLVEAGPDDRHPMIDMPKGFARILASPEHMYYFEAQPGSDGKQAPETWIRGRTLGGSSSVNGMQYQRGHREDYDHWERDLGLAGWGWDAMERTFRLLEDHDLGEAPWRGVGGPVRLSQSTNRTVLMDKVIEAAGELGVPHLEDPSDSREEGISYICAIISKGRRWSAARAFLDPARNRANLTISTRTEARRIVFDGQRASGVECLRGDELVTVGARREVILSAGTLCSPKLLQLSGVGDGEHLASIGIPVLRESARVGANLREHLILTVQYRLTGDYSQNKDYSGWRLGLHGLKYMLTRKGLLATSPYDITAFLKVHPDSPKTDAKIVAAPITMDLSKWEGFHKQIPMESEPGCSMIGYVLQPQSQGTVQITSNDPAAPPAIVHNALSHEYDQKIAVALARYIRRIFAQPAIAPYIAGETLPGERFQSDEELLEAYAMMSGPGFHAAGTCAMGSGEDSVTDERLRVRGVSGLRVVDLSVFPTLVSGNTHGPVMAVASRGADLILEDAAGAA